MSVNTQRNEKALGHLKTLKPYDGWSLDTYTSSTGNEMVMLKRRNAPLYTKGFQAIAYDENDSKCIIGITSSIGDTNNTEFCRGIVLVDKNGDVARDQKAVRVRLKKDGVDATKKEKELNDSRQATRRNLENARESVRSGGSTRASGATTGANNGAGAGAGANVTDFLSNLSEEQTAQLTKLGLMLVGVVIILRILSNISTVLYVVVLPLGMLYGMSTLPSIESFDAKKELKRVLRGHHLPENHPDKPKDDWLSSTIARVTASVATELATSLGYELSVVNIFGVCNFVTVTVPLANKELYWIGIFGSWHYLLQKDLPKPEQRSM